MVVKSSCLSRKVDSVGIITSGEVSFSNTRTTRLCYSSGCSSFTEINQLSTWYIQSYTFPSITIMARGPAKQKEAAPPPPAPEKHGYEFFGP
jgi:hypothetical protein